MSDSTVNRVSGSVVVCVYFLMSVAELHVVPGHAMVFIVVLAIALNHIESSLGQEPVGCRVARCSWTRCGFHCRSCHRTQSHRESVSCKMGFSVERGFAPTRVLV